MTTWISTRRNVRQATPPQPKKPTGPRDVQDTPDLEKYLLLPSSKSNPNTTGPSKSLYCGICADIFKRPMRAPCGHSFCQRCITTWLSMNKTCPQDRKPLVPNQLHHDFIIESIISEQPAVCPFKDSGCRFGIHPLPEIRQHAAKCDFNPDVMPDFIRAVLPVPGAKNESPFVISDDENENRSPNHPISSHHTPVSSSAATNRRRIVIDSSPEEEAVSSNAALPLRLRLLRQGGASVDQLRDVVGS